jgi:hypothetical protein
MQIYDFAMAGAMYVISGIMFWQMRHIDAPDSRVLPTIIALLLILLATALIIVRLLKRDKKEAYDFRNSSRGLIMLAILLVFVLCSQWFGFFVSTPFFLLGAMVFLGQRDKRTLVLVPILGTAAIVVLFQFIFQVSLPEGTIFNIFKYI